MIKESLVNPKSNEAINNLQKNLIYKDELKELGKLLLYRPN